MSKRDSWKTEHGTKYLCSGPITWSPDLPSGNAFERFARLGITPVQLNELLGEKIYDSITLSLGLSEILDELEDEIRDDLAA